MYIATRPIPTLPNHFKIIIRRPIKLSHELSIKVEVLSINDFYMDTCTIAELRILEIFDGQYICAIEDNSRCAFCVGRDSYDDFLGREVITLLSIYPSECL